jgi:hypothetical protein
LDSNTTKIKFLKMKNIIKGFTSILIGSLLLGLNTGCKKLADFGTTNVNPNGSNYVSTGSLISAVEARLGSRTYGLNDPAAETLAGFFAQYFAEPTYPGSSKYTTPQVNASGFYAGALNDLKAVIDRNTAPASKVLAATSGSNENQIAIARILRAYIFWTIADRWGDVPYSEALQGTAILTPKYDKQELIYKDLLKELTEADAQFDPAGVTVKPENIFSGDVTKWKKTANSLRMLIALRMSKVYPNAGDLAATEFSSALNSGNIIDANADNFALTYAGNTLQFNNPWNATGNSADLGESQTMTDALSNMGDNRINAFGTTPTGVPYGLSSGAPAATYAKILATAFKANNSTFVFISAGDVLLAKAEGIERGWVSGLTTADAQLAYNAGVTASYGRWNLTVPAGYLAGGPADYNTGAGAGAIGGASVAGTNGSTSTKLSRINLQQWFSFYPNGIQGWSNWRRTGVPDLKPTVNAVNTTGQIPRRYTYGNLDYSLNAEQVALAAIAIGGDKQDTRVWWDKP